jgi:hypothetical protein
MDKVALLPAEERAILFGARGAIRGVIDTVDEKDFWIFWLFPYLEWNDA